MDKPKIIELDARTWNRVQLSEPRVGGDYTLEYLPEGQEKSGWREMVTDQFLANPQDEQTAKNGSAGDAQKSLTAGAFAGSFAQQLRKIGASSVDQRETDHDLIISWNGKIQDVAPSKDGSRKGSQPNDESGVARVREQINGLRVAQYTHRYLDQQNEAKPLMSSTDVKLWSDRLAKLLDTKDATTR